MIHLIGFYTQGPPIDESNDLTESKKKFQTLYENQVDTLKLYSTTHMMVKNSQFKNYIDPLPKYKFLEGWTHHFWKWKPFVIYEHMKTMKDGDILVYHDCDILNQKEYEKGVTQFRKNVMNIMEKNELVCSMDTLYGKNKDVIKEELFLKFGDYRDTKRLKTNRIFIKKNPKTLQFIYNWLLLCNTTLLLPNYTEKHTYSESLFNVLYYKYIEMRELTYPNIYFKENMFSTETIFFLDNPKSGIVQKIKESSSIFKPKTTIPVPARRMLQPHQSNRSIMMTLIPIAKPPTPHVRQKPASFFTLNKHSR
jgi:hypothetical protein